MQRRRLLSLPLLLISAAGGLMACVPNRPEPVAAPAPVWQPEPEELGEDPEILESRVVAPKRDILGDVEYDLPVEANSWVEAELDFLVEERREVIQRWIERGDFYEAFVKAELRAQGVPTDLYHLAMIESGFIPTARSRAGAVGMWQFMPATGRAMGLRIDAEVDERMDPIRSTRAAARHLRDLRKEMGTWALAAAAYNAGPGRINRGLRATSARNFWELAERGDLAAETQHYVPRLYAMTVIARGRDRFGFPASSAAAFAFDSITVEFATPLQELARMGEVSLEELRRLNPHLVTGITPSGGYWVWVPVNRGPELQRAYLASDFRKERGLGAYVVRRGDYLGRIAERSGVNMSRIRQLNPGVDFDPLQIGVKLRMPYSAAQTLTKLAEAAAEERPAPEARVASAQPERRESSARSGGTQSAGTHEVRSGETLWQIAQANDVTVEALQKANDLDGSTIRPGMELRIPGAGAASGKSEAAYAAAASAPVHEVRDGESLWQIARDNGVSVEALQKANGLSGATIRPGQKLKLPSGAEAPAPAPRVAHHVVQGGETLWGIARKYGTSVEKIQEANQLGSGPIQPGQKLEVPL